MSSTSTTPVTMILFPTKTQKMKVKLVEDKLVEDKLVEDKKIKLVEDKKIKLVEDKKIKKNIKKYKKDNIWEIKDIKVDYNLILSFILKVTYMSDKKLQKELNKLPTTYILSCNYIYLHHITNIITKMIGAIDKFQDARDDILIQNHLISHTGGRDIGCDEGSSSCFTDTISACSKNVMKAMKNVIAHSTSHSGAYLTCLAIDFFEMIFQNQSEKKSEKKTVETIGWNLESSKFDDELEELEEEKEIPESWEDIVKEDEVKSLELEEEKEEDIVEEEEVKSLELEEEKEIPESWEDIVEEDEVKSEEDMEIVEEYETEMWDKYLDVIDSDDEVVPVVVPVHNSSRPVIPKFHQTNHKTYLCRNFSNGYCKFGEHCGFAHGVQELRSMTKLQNQTSVPNYLPVVVPVPNCLPVVVPVPNCLPVVPVPNCLPVVVPVHNYLPVVVPVPNCLPVPKVQQTNHKTHLCRNFSNGYCKFGENCGFAHGEQELQAINSVCRFGINCRTHKCRFQH